MKLIAENIDFYPETLIDVVDIVNELIHKEDRNFDDIKRIKNIIDDLDSFNMTLILQDIDMVKYSMLLSMNHVNVERIDNDEIKFEELDLVDTELNHVYSRLIQQYLAFEEILGFESRLMEYLQPNSRLVDVRISMSIKDFIYFSLTCSKYDELLDVNVLLSNFDDLLEKLVTISMSLYDMISVDDLFIRMTLDEENRKSILDSGSININVISNEEYINHCIDNYQCDVKLSTIGSCSLVAYRELVSSIPKQQIKIENLFDLIGQEYISITFPKEFSGIESNLLNALDGYLYEWYTLVDKLSKKEGMELKAMLCCLGCFSNIFKMNTAIENYFLLLHESESSEIFDLMSVLEDKIMN